MILNQSQAEAVYSAMCALNNVGAELAGTVKFTDGTIFSAWTDGGVSAHPPGDDPVPEIFDSQTEFAVAYGLN